MHVYGSQLAPLLEALVTAGGLDGISPEGASTSEPCGGQPPRLVRPGEAEAHGAGPMGSESARPRTPDPTRSDAGYAVARLNAREAISTESSAQAPVVTSPVTTSGDVNCALNRARIARVAWYSGLNDAIVRSQSGASDIGSMIPDRSSKGRAIAWVSGASASSLPMTSAMA